MPTAVEYIMTIEGITTDPISTPFESYSFGAASSGSLSSGSGAGAGKVNFNPFSITRKIDRASPVLFKACVTGQYIKKVTLELRPAIQKGTVPSLLVVTLMGVFVVTVREGGNVHGDIVPMEEISFEFRSFQMTVEGISLGYDLGLGKVI